MPSSRCGCAAPDNNDVVVNRMYALLLVAACAAGRPAAPAPAPAAQGSDVTFCVDEINRYRKRAGRRPLRRSAELERYAAAGAKHDVRVRRAHDHFARVPMPGPLSAAAENEIPWWPLQGTVRDVIRAGIASMWNEGRGGGHYENLVGHFDEVGCGLHVGRGEVTIVQDFRLR